jgi:hypothetical protein
MIFLATGVLPYLRCGVVQELVFFSTNNHFAFEVLTSYTIDSPMVSVTFRCYFHSRHSSVSSYDAPIEVEEGMKVEHKS